MVDMTFGLSHAFDPFRHSPIVKRLARDIRGLSIVSVAFIAAVQAGPALSQPSETQAQTTETLRDLSGSVPSSPVGDITLVTKNKNLEELGRELSRIYLTLYNSKRLSVRPALWKPTGPSDVFSSEAVFRSEGIYYGKTFPLELDNLACDLNPKICTRERVAAGSDQLQSLTGHVSGYLPSTTQWPAQPSTPLLVPDVKLTPDIEWFTVQKNAKMSIADTVVNDLGGCAKFDDKCRDLLQFYNRTLGGKLFDEAYRGPVALPVLTLQASTNVASAAEIPNLPNAAPPVYPQDTQLTLQPVTESNSKSRDSFKVLQGVEVDPGRFESVTVQQEKVLKQLNRNVIRSMRIKAFQTSTAPLAGDALFLADVEGYRKDLHNLIAVPEKLRKMPFPDEYIAHVDIGVVDMRIDDKHCAFQTGQITAQNFSSPPDLGPAAKCNLRVVGNDKVDHATHVAGVIAAHFPDGTNMVPVGLNPYARIFSMEINMAGLNDEQIGKELKKLVQKHQLKVVNMSFGYLMSAQNPDLQPTDPLEQPIAGLQGTTLFVAAAGNAGADKSYMCDLRPACFDLPNVIAVAGIDRDADKPTFLESNTKSHSNFGRRIHIAAIGKDVFSSLANGRYGVLTGTSQAAPQVAAVASLMVSKYPTLLPVAIKNRLIYCSDILNSLRDKLFGGRLNAECALDGDAGRLQLESPPDKVQRGKFQPGSVFHFIDEQDTAVDIPIQLVRSVAYDPEQDSFTVFHTTRNRSDASLLRTSNLTLKNPEEKIKFTPVGGAVAEIHVKQIKRYVSPIK
jgi:subtilisin family serine protease